MQQSSPRAAILVTSLSQESGGSSEFVDLQQQNIHCHFQSLFWHKGSSRLPFFPVSFRRRFSHGGKEFACQRALGLANEFVFLSLSVHEHPHFFLSALSHACFVISSFWLVVASTPSKNLRLSPFTASHHGQWFFIASAHSKFHVSVGPKNSWGVQWRLTWLAFSRGVRSGSAWNPQACWHFSWACAVASFRTSAA
jgi:hypothetical protein